MKISIRDTAKLINNYAMRRENVKEWKNEIMQMKPQAEEIIGQLREQTADLLEKRAEAWIGENKLIHAGAAKKLADELRGKSK